MPQKHKFNTIDEALEDIAKGKMIILVDDPLMQTLQPDEARKMFRDTRVPLQPPGPEMARVYDLVADAGHGKIPAIFAPEVMPITSSFRHWSTITAAAG